MNKEQTSEVPLADKMPISLVLPEFAQFNLDSGEIKGGACVRRFLRDLSGSFASETDYEAALAHANPLVYTVSSLEPASGEGQLHYGLGVIQPGKVGQEYFLTKGHFHAWRPAAEIYIGLRGEGLMLLEEEDGSQARAVPLTPHSAVYVPGNTAHRTVNTSDVPLVYLGIYPAGAGHDYGALAERNFRLAVMERDGHPAVVRRDELTTNVRPPAGREDDR